MTRPEVRPDPPPAAAGAEVAETPIEAKSPGEGDAATEMIQSAVKPEQKRPDEIEARAPHEAVASAEPTVKPKTPAGGKLPESGGERVRKETPAKAAGCVPMMRIGLMALPALVWLLSVPLVILMGIGFAVDLSKADNAIKQAAVGAIYGTSIIGQYVFARSVEKLCGMTTSILDAVAARRASSAGVEGPRAERGDEEQA